MRRSDRTTEGPHLLFLWVSGRPASLAFQLALPSMLLYSRAA